MCVSVNVSARQIVEPGLPEAVSEALARERPGARVPVTRDNGERPARAPRRDARHARAHPSGSACASRWTISAPATPLSRYLKRFPIDELKIDRAFVTDVARSDEDGELVAAIVAMAHALGFSVVAEGVETEEQLEALQDLDVNRAQGYLFSPPVPAGEAGHAGRGGWWVRSQRVAYNHGMEPRFRDACELGAWFARTRARGELWVGYKRGAAGRASPGRRRWTRRSAWMDRRSHEARGRDELQDRFTARRAARGASGT